MTTPKLGRPSHCLLPAVITALLSGCVVTPGSGTTRAVQPGDTNPKVTVMGFGQFTTSATSTFKVVGNINPLHPEPGPYEVLKQGGASGPTTFFGTVALTPFNIVDVPVPAPRVWPSDGVARLKVLEYPSFAPSLPFELPALNAAGEYAAPVASNNLLFWDPGNATVQGRDFRDQPDGGTLDLRPVIGLVDVPDAAPLFAGNDLQPLSKGFFREESPASPTRDPSPTNPEELSWWLLQQDDSRPDRREFPAVRLAELRFSERSDAGIARRGIPEPEPPRVGDRHVQRSRKADVGGLIQTWYSSGGVTAPGAVANSDNVPTGWSSQPTLYRDVFAPYCRSCHAALPPYTFANAASAQGLRIDISKDVCLNRIMPHSKVAYENFWKSGARAQLLISLNLNHNCLGH